MGGGYRLGLTINRFVAKEKLRLTEALGMKGGHFVMVAKFKPFGLQELELICVGWLISLLCNSSNGESLSTDEAVDACLKAGAKSRELNC